MKKIKILRSSVPSFPKKPYLLAKQPARYRSK